MVGLVVVSHSPALASAAVELAMEMVSVHPPRIATAAGVAGATFGTDAVAVKSAIERVDEGDGVVVLMDLGSAVLSSELALDLIDPELRERVYLTAAPLVEGLVAAAVQAAAGEPPSVVIREAVAGLGGKQAQLGSSAAAEEAGGADTGGKTAVITIGVPHGLHARPAARLVALVKQFDATVRLRNMSTGSAYAPAGSLSRVAAIGAKRGHDVEVHSSGRQAIEARDGILALAARDFDEPAAEAPTPLVVAETANALPASPGIAIGPKWTIGGGEILVPEAGEGFDPVHEWSNFCAATNEVREEMAKRHARLLSDGAAAEAGIFAAHMMLLDDDEILQATHEAIEQGRSAPGAWQRAMRQVETAWAALDDSYLRARAADVRAVCNQVLRRLVGTDTKMAPPQEAILVASGLTPNDTAQIDADRVAGIVTADGSPSSHAAILARALGIPAVVAAGDAVLDIPDGTVLVIDGSKGTLLVDPSPDVVRAHRTRAGQPTAAENGDGQPHW